ncbi:MAG: hypothetical protein H6581_24055 [Bacteroidia bacterium]|nr:hypothetical protein [Bacteroidia bacterium]
MKELKITLIASVLSAFLAVQGFGQADLVSGNFVWDVTGTYLGPGYEHVFKNRLALGGDVGYCWIGDIFNPRRSTGSVFYYQFNYRAYGKYYFLFAKRNLGEGIYGQLSVDGSFIKGRSGSEPFPRAIFEKEVGIGLGGNWFFWKGAFVGLNANLIFGERIAYSIPSPHTHNIYFQKFTWQPIFYSKLGWNIGWKP